MNPKGRTRHWECTVLLLGILFLSIAGVAMPVAAEAPLVTGQALEWSLVDPVPSSLETGEQFTVKLNFRNIGDVNLTGNKRVTIELSVEGKDLGSTKLEDLKTNGTQQVSFKTKLSDEGTYQLKLNAYNGGIVKLYDSAGRQTATIHTVEVEFIEEPFNPVPIIIVVVIAAVGGGVFYFINQRKKKAEEERRLAEEARRQEMIRKKEEEIAKKIEVRHVAGKHPRDYYVLRRTKYANLKPSGMTSSGLNILRKVKSRAELEAERIVCPKCGSDLKNKDDVCQRCEATEKIEAIRHEIRSYKSQAPVSFKDSEALLRKAEHRLNWSDFTMALDLVNRAENTMHEIWEAAEKGQTVESTVVEFAEGEGPSLDSKIIGLEGEDLSTATPVTPAVEEIELEGPVGEPCPKCGNPMDDGECLICGFTDKLNAVWAVIERAELDGADMSEVKELCRQANSAMERESEESARRYLRRAIRLGDETYHDHARSKTEGIIEFTNTLIHQVKGMDEDASLAEQMISQAKAIMAEGDYEGARSMAAKADGYLKQMREDSYRKQIREIMPEVEAGAASNQEVQTLLGKAKKLIEAGELEGAVDLLEAAKARL